MKLAYRKIDLLVREFIYGFFRRGKSGLEKLIPVIIEFLNRFILTDLEFEFNL